MKELSLKVVVGIVVLMVLFALAPSGTVPAGHRGGKTTFGSPSGEVLSEGIHFRLPLAQKINLVNVSIQKGEGEGDAASRDLQIVHTRVALNYHVKPEGAVSVFRDLGNEPGERMIIPSVQEAVKAVTARFTAEELIAKRTDVRDQIVAQLRERLARHAIMWTSFRS
jgi:regulator of protease activity HflC (stomatin/prohibitin superfamily)